MNCILFFIYAAFLMGLFRYGWGEFSSRTVGGFLWGGVILIGASLLVIASIVGAYDNGTSDDEPREKKTYSKRKSGLTGVLLGLLLGYAFWGD